MTSEIVVTASVTTIEQWADLLVYLWVWCLLQERPGAWQCLPSPAVQLSSTSSHPVSTKPCCEVPRFIEPIDLEHVSLHFESSMMSTQLALSDCYGSYAFSMVLHTCNQNHTTSKKHIQSRQVQSWHVTLLQNHSKCTLDCCSSSIVLLQYVCITFSWKDAHVQGLNLLSWALRSAL